MSRPSRFAWALPLFVLAACGRSSLDDLALGGGAGLASGGGGPGPVGPGGGSPVGPGGGSPVGPGPGPGPGGGGGEGPCTLSSECDDGDPCTTDVCQKNGFCDARPRDDDGDGVAPPSCGGDDCNDQNPDVFPGNFETCANGSDDDCNGVADCLDPVCTGQPDCGCVPSIEDCDDGADDDCDGLADCFDLDCAGTPACGCAASESTPFCADGFDQDCDGAIDCDDSQCASDPGCVCVGSTESCDNLQDDDCDGLVDCADVACTGIFPCTCLGPPQPEQCANVADDDCDGLVDCADPDCFLSPACDVCGPEICGNGIDDDCDNRIDCADDACTFAPGCEPQPEICNNGADDDGDGLADCLDPECAAVPFCQEEQSSCLTSRFIPGSGTYFGDTTGNPPQERGSCGGDAGEAVFHFVLDAPSRVHLDTSGSSFDSVLHVRVGSCESGAEIGCDDDSGGSFAAQIDFTILYPGTYFVFVDGFTINPFGGPDQGPFVLNVEIEEDPAEICGNGIDDDGDVFVDCADPACTDAPGCAGCVGGADPTPEFGTERCTNGLDDDCDGTADCSDQDCSASDFYVTECCDGVDENGNGFPDDFNCRCASDADCDPGQLCYGHTARVCGFPCDAFVGQICPFVAAGSSCSPVTQQCEF